MQSEALDHTNRHSATKKSSVVVLVFDKAVLANTYINSLASLL